MAADPRHNSRGTYPIFEKKETADWSTLCLYILISFMASICFVTEKVAQRLACNLFTYSGPGFDPACVIFFFWYFFILKNVWIYIYFFRSTERHQILFTMSRASSRYAFYFHEHPESKVMSGQLNSAGQLPPPYLQKRTPTKC